jgi:uncharacterized protein YjbI with pentapeptide repeats
MCTPGARVRAPPAGGVPGGGPPARPQRSTLTAHHVLLAGMSPETVAYHTSVRCRRGDGCTCREGPVIVGPMYRVGEVCVCEGAASAEEKARGPVEPAKRFGSYGPPLEGLDLRGWKKADIQGLRGADGTLDLKGAILCGADLRGAQLQGADLKFAQLQGADLTHAQLQGANLREAQLQGADLREAQLQGADLRWAQLQGANLYSAELQGANLYSAELQGADLREAQLQGANLREADLSVLPKGFLLPKRMSAGETEATQADWPTDLGSANLSMLPKGSKYCDGLKVKVSDAARPTDLTDAKASGANFTGADLSGANLTGATIDHATLKDATFAPLNPPERAASGILSRAWQAKALMGSVGRAVVAAVDDDDDDNDDSGDESDVGEENETPDGIEAKMEEALEACMSKLANGAKVFMREVAELLRKVEEHTVSLLTSALKNRLCKKLKEVGVNQAAINAILSTLVISPLLDFIRAYTLDEAGCELLKTYKTQVLGGAGKAALKRLSPIVNKCVRASSARVAPGSAVDEEQALLIQPEDSAACLMRELWPALLASLEAQASHSHPRKSTSTQLTTKHQPYVHCMCMLCR